MSKVKLPASFRPGDVANGTRGQRAHPQSIEHTARLEQRLYRIGAHAWTLVGNGLSNQTFVEGPEGLIVIDTGECVEEMRSALKAIREVTQAPIVACIYSHFHYVNGTRAVLEAEGIAQLPIYGHVGIAANLKRFGGEVGPRYARGLVHQFGLLLPAEGPDAVENVGLGLFLRNPQHAPYSDGYLPANHTFASELTATIAGLESVMTHAPSDSSDSITIWFPALELAVQNLAWPALFNVFPIRGEEYRDPRIVIRGLDHLRSLSATHLAGAHGPPLSGAEEVHAVLSDYRDAIQFLWDQTVRGANKGLCLDELVEFVQLPEYYARNYHTRQLYGLVEHHVRQIYTGLFGWFDENEANLFPLPTVERAARLIEGFGGRDQVRTQASVALKAEDYRWAVELASWLVRSATAADGRADAGEPADRRLLAGALRGIAYNTPSANVRCWCLTRALELEGTADLRRFRGHRFRKQEVQAAEPHIFIEMLRVLLDPHKAEDLEDTLVWVFADGARVGLTIRGGVAVPDPGTEASKAIKLSLDTWSDLLGGKRTLAEALADGTLETEGDEGAIRRFLAAFDVPAFH